VSIVEILKALFLTPLIEIWATLFDFIIRHIQDPGLTVILLSVSVNILLTPIYFQMERASQKRNQHRDAMLSEIDRIKAHYKGRERYYYIKTIHRQFNYKNWHGLLISPDLLLQVVVFASVYQYLSHNPVMAGVAWGPIQNLAEPDKLLWGVNLLPFAMTMLNILSAWKYTSIAKKRYVALGFAALFLVLLYNSPAALLLYWTSNNLFSYLRNLASDILKKSLSKAGTAIAKIAEQA